jgi:hypothetical protein
MQGALKLRALDKDDLLIVAGFLQDAIVPIGEMCFLADEKRFVMVVNRFKWESCNDSVPVSNSDASYDGTADAPVPYERIHCGIRFDGIAAVRTRNVNLHDRHQILSLLTLECTDDAVLLHFSGGACIRLESRHWQCWAEDLGESWPTLHRPCHPVGEEALGEAGVDKAATGGRPAA